MGMTVAVLAIIGAALLGYATERAGWFGIPLAVVVSLTLYMTELSRLSEVLPFVIGMITAGLASSGLPHLDWLLATITGVVVVSLAILAIVFGSGGGDSPLFPILIADSIGFLLGALGRGLYQAHVGKIRSHG